MDHQCRYSFNTVNDEPVQWRRLSVLNIMNSSYWLCGSVKEETAEFHYWESFWCWREADLFFLIVKCDTSANTAPFHIFPLCVFSSYKFLVFFVCTEIVRPPSQVWWSKKQKALAQSFEMTKNEAWTFCFVNEKLLRRWLYSLLEPECDKNTEVPLRSWSRDLIDLLLVRQQSHSRQRGIRLVQWE